MTRSSFAAIARPDRRIAGAASAMASAARLLILIVMFHSLPGLVCRIQITSQLGNRNQAFIRFTLHAIPERLAEDWCFKLEHIAGFGPEARSIAQQRRAEEIAMQIAGPAEHRIFEVMMFEIGEGMRHVRLARQEVVL